MHAILLRKTFAFLFLLTGSLLLGCEQSVTDAVAADEPAQPAAEQSSQPASAADGDEYAYIREQFPSIEIDEIGPAPIEGLLQMAVGADVFYVSKDGRYFLQAEVMDMTTRANITDEARNLARARFLDDFDRDSTVTFVADDEKYRVLVFTDIDCGYCRKLHRQIGEYNRRGITVQYAFFPRSGPNTDSWSKSERVWCAESRTDAMTSAKANESFESSDCGETPVAAHYEMVNKLGLRGTPSIFTESGTLQMGYLSPEELQKLLEAETT